MHKLIALLLPPLLLGACATVPQAEVPIEEAQRRLLTEPPVLVADGCLHRRNAFYLDHYIIDESRDLDQRILRRRHGYFATYRFGRVGNNW